MADQKNSLNQSTPKQLNKRLRSFVNFLAGPVLLHYTLPILMLYLVAGTIAQKYIGLYEATHLFFADPILWVGDFLPIPGMPIFMALLFINMLCKLLFKSPWVFKNAGIIITHISVLLLLVGGLMTALWAKEGFIDLATNETKAFVTDYHQRQLMLLNDQDDIIETITFNDITKNQPFSFQVAPFQINPLEQCRNCEIKIREDGNSSFQGMASKMRLVDKKLEKQNEQNMAGLTFEVRPKESKEKQTWVVLEDIPKLPEISWQDQVYRVALQKSQRSLPFEVTLLEVNRDLHPGTGLAKAYQSKVRITDGAARWESLIKMNEPLRYKGYTLYQSSFIQTPQGNISVLAVVWNIGRVFPYLSGLLLALGLAVHVFIRRKKTIKQAI